MCISTEESEPWVLAYLVIGLNQTLGTGFHRQCKLVRAYYYYYYYY